LVSVRSEARCKVGATRDEKMAKNLKKRKARRASFSLAFFTLSLAGIVARFHLQHLGEVTGRPESHPGSA
jgi:hypothetical protein